MIKVSVILLLISLALLVIYGLDTMVASQSKTTDNNTAGGFLPLNEALRGGIFGGGAVALSVIGFAIGRNDPSKAIPVLLFINGGLIIIGMILVMLLSGTSVNGIASRTIGSTMIFGGLLIGLGIVKIILEKRTTIRT